MQFRLLDLFCGAGGCAKGYREAGFWVRGVDIEPQPKYAGNDFVQGDALGYLQGLIDSGEIASFDAVHASPPCQAHSALRNMWNSRPHADLIPQTRELLQASGLPFVMENVPGAPLENAPLFGVWRVMLCGTMFGLQTKCGAQLQRHRFFELNWESEIPPSCQHSEADMIGVTGSGQPVGSKKRRTITITGSTPQQNVVRNQVRQTYPVDAAREAMGIDWMPMKSLSQAIPPAYTKYLGVQLIRVCEKLQASALHPSGEAETGRRAGSKHWKPSPAPAPQARSTARTASPSGAGGRRRPHPGRDSSAELSAINDGVLQVLEIKGDVYDIGPSGERLFVPAVDLWGGGIWGAYDDLPTR